ncbi:MFS transporter [Trueperella pecoris]|uniref:MFS transporter n=1 Tax=Trueperella pecoris TaxID=2733571 RepID=A0A7M1R2K3_9ACTO|nr:MFS transporter [Trueperella pecoris]QOR48371.1 MFS transporter [Trueperella pecoris]
MSTQLSRQPNQPDANPRHIRVAGSDRIYDRNKLLIVLLVPLMMTLLQVSSVNNVLSAMGHALSASDAQLQWILSGYALAVGIVLVPAGRLGDLFGRSSAFVAGFVLFTLSSLLVGLASDATFLNLMRVLQGIGAGILSPQTTGLIQRYFVGQARAKAFAMFGLVVSMSVAAGPLMSGALVAIFGEDRGWRWSFMINFPIGVIGLILAFLWLPFGKERRHVGTHRDEARAEYIEMQAEEGHFYERPKIDLDPIGMLLLAFSVVGVMVPFMSTGWAYAWTLLPAGIALLVAWVFWEKAYKVRGHEPMVDLRLFSIRTFSWSTAIAALQFLGMTSIFVILAMFLQRGLQVTALDVGLVTLPNALMSAYAAMWAGKRAVLQGRGVQVIALSLMLAGALGAMAMVWGVEHGLSYWWLTIPVTILGFGQGAMGSANQTQSMLDVPAEHGGTAGGVMQTGQRIATAIGIAMITAAFFVSQRSYAGGAGGWYFAVYVAYAIISLIILIALLLGVAFWREGRRAA